MTIKMQDFVNIIDNNINIIDIRDELSYNKSHIEGAINIGKEDLLYNKDKYLNKNEKYYIYCYHGNISRKVSNELNYYGYNTISIDGGYNNYLLIK